MIIFSLHHNFIFELKNFKSRFVMDSPRCFCKSVIIICNSCFHHRNSSEKMFVDFSPTLIHIAAERFVLCRCCWCFVFVTTHNIIAINHAFLVKTKISSNCPAMFHVIIVWSHYLPIFVRHTAHNQERDIRNQCILLSIWLLEHRSGSTIILLHHRHRSLSIHRGVNLVVVLALWNYYCESAAGAHSLSADYLMCSQTFSMRRSWWSSFALTPTRCDIRRADEHWCGERQDVPSMDSAGSTVRKTELIFVCFKCL